MGVHTSDVGDIRGLRIRLLGGLDVEGVDLATFGSRKARTLLKRLAVDANAVVSTDALVDALWPESDAPARPAEQVSVLVSRLRRVLGTERITYDDRGYTLHCDWLDLGALVERADEATRRLEDGAVAASLAASTAALALLRGPLLPDEAGAPWTEAMRASVDRLVARVRNTAAAAALTAGRPWEAAEHAATALIADPYDEHALRLLMRAHVASGRPALALTAYADSAARIADDLGVDLSPETQALHVAVLRGDVAAPPAAHDDQSQPSLVGRDDVLATIDRAFERSRADAAVVISLEGEAGIGKTRLLRAIGDRFAARATVLSSTSDPTGVLPLEPILDALASRLAAYPTEERSAVLGPEAELLGPLLRPGADVDNVAYRDLLVAHEPGLQSAPAVLHVAVLAVVSRLCEREPTVLLVDDAHHADPATLTWLGLVTRRATGLRLLVVVARRPTDGAPVPGAETIELDRLDRQAAAALVCQVTGSAVDDAVITALFDRSAGHPLFLVELAHVSGDVMPDSIRQAVVDRLADAGSAGTTLRAAAVLGSHVDVDLLATVLEQPTAQLLNELEEGMHRHLLDDAPSGYVFRHEILREALDADTPTARRRWLHRSAARVLSARSSVDHLLVAHHARLGDDAALAAVALRHAADRAGARFDHDEALRLATESITLEDSADAHLVRARSLVLLSRYAEARTEADAALDLGGGGAALEAAAHAAYYSRDLDEVLRLADVARATTDDAEVLDWCQFLAGKVLHTTGQVTAMVSRLTPIVEAPAPTRIRPFAQVWLTLAHAHRGHVDAATRTMRDANRASTVPVPFAALYVEQFRAHVAGLAGRPVDAVAAATRLRALVAEQQAMRFVGRAEVYLGWARWLLCDAAAADALEEAREVAATAGNPEPRGQGSLDLARLWLDRGMLDNAAGLLTEVAALTASQSVSNGWRIDLRRRYLEGRLALAAGDPATAQVAAAEVRDRAQVDALDRYSVLASLLEIEAAAVDGAVVDVDRVGRLVETLDDVSRPDAWRITAGIARALDSERLRAKGHAQAERIAVAAGEWAPGIRVAAAAALNPG
jgi:DNA-binding SARP family transcriptional activator